MERVPVDRFLKELEESLEDNTIGAGDPAEYDLRWALNDQVKEYVLRRMKRLLKGQDFVYLKDATGRQGDVLTRDDWEEIDYDDW